MDWLQLRRLYLHLYHFRLKLNQGGKDTSNKSVTHQDLDSINNDAGSVYPVKNSPSSSDLIVSPKALQTTTKKKSQIEYENLFDGTSLYPIAFQKVEVEARAAAIFDIYPNAKIADGGHAFSVSPEGTIFNQVVFRFLRKNGEESPKINAIYFYIKKEYKDQFRAEVVEFMQPFEVSRDRLTTAVKWVDVSGVTVELTAEDTYVLRSLRL